MKPGIYEDIDNSAYHAGEGISSSELKLILRSPAHLKEASDNPRPQTPAMALGTAVHALVLEPDKRVVPEVIVNKRTKDGRAELEAFHMEHADAIICTQDQYSHAIKMRDSLLLHPTASVLFAAGVAERSHYWTDDTTGELCKVRPDFYNTDHDVCVDLKTSSDASKDSFLRSLVNFGYDLSASYYLHGLDQTGIKAIDFIFVVVENMPPYPVAIYTLQGEMLHKGHVLWRRALDRLHECKTNNQWPGYPDEIQVLDCPAWALRV